MPQERTPFDESIPPPDDESGDYDESEFEEEFENEEQENARPRGLPRWFWLALGAIGLMLMMTFGGILAGQRAENQRLGELRERIGAIARNDNALVLEILGADGSQNITYAEFFNRAAKNKSDRDTLVRKLRTMVAPSYQTEIDNLVRLLEIENEYVRAEEAVTRQKLEVATRHDALEEIADANNAGLNSPYVPPSGDEYGGQSLETARQSNVAFRKYKEARETMTQKLGAATTAIENWIEAEPKFYPNWAPPRNVTDALQAKKRRYNITTSDPNAQPNAPINPAPDASTGSEWIEPPLPEPEPTEEPTLQPTPEPTVEEPIIEEPTPAPEVTPAATSGEPTDDQSAIDAPVRDDALDRLPGERFAQTRTRELSPDGLTRLSDQDLRYMTNEMFARYGQTFGDKSYQAQFEDKSWYRPNPKWSSSRIRRAFTDLEKENLKLLIQERARRKANGN